MKLTSDWKTLKAFNAYLNSGWIDGYHRLTPASHRYISLLNPINLFDLKDAVEELKHFEFCMVRDGLLTLLPFFLKHPEPGNIKPTLLIHDSLKGYVPAAWKDQTKTYSFYLNNPGPMGPSNCHALIVKGLIHDTYQVSAPNQLQHQIVRLLAEGAQFEQIYFMPATKGSLCTDSAYDSSSIQEKILVECWDQLKRLGKKHNIVSTEDIKRSVDFRETCFMDIDPTGLIYMDDYTDTYLLSRGSRPVFTHKSAKLSETDIGEISPYHGIVVAKPEQNNSRFDLLQKQLQELSIAPGEIEFFHLLQEDFNRNCASLNKWNIYE